jgi:hypothetical protein
MDTEQFAWREIVSRIFEGFEVQRDVAPTWMTNPDTGRLLKLNYLYPQIKVAVRLEGLRGPAQQREPDELELSRQQERESARERLCEQQGLRLLSFNVYDEPHDAFMAIQAALAWAMRQAATAADPQEDKLRLVEQLRQARARADEIRARSRTSRDLKTWADLWVDRAYREARTSPRPVSSGPAPRYALSMRLRHPDFGTGRVIALSDEEGDQIVTVRFDNGDERQFLAQLVTDKLRPV